MKTKTCKVCKEKFTPSRPLQVVCSPACAFVIVNKVCEKERKSLNKATKIKLKSLSDYKNELQTQINLIARLIDEGCPCISSGRTTGKMNGGHRFSTGAFDNLRFNLLNIWIQSFSDNHFKSGNSDGFDKGLTKLNAYDMVHELPTKYPFIKLQKSDLVEKIIIAKNIVKELKLLNSNLTGLHDPITQRDTAVRLWMRNEYNQELGIYL